MQTASQHCWARKGVAEVIEQYKEKLRTISDVSRAHLESVCTKLFPGFKSVMRVVVMFAMFEPVERPQPYAVPTERRVRVFNTSASYSCSNLSHETDYSEVYFLVLLSPSRQMPE
jgi:hypothetical protein